MCILNRQLITEVKVERNLAAEVWEIVKVDEPNLITGHNLPLQLSKGTL